MLSLTIGLNYGAGASPEKQAGINLNLASGNVLKVKKPIEQLERLITYINALKEVYPPIK